MVITQLQILMGNVALVVSILHVQSIIGQQITGTSVKTKCKNMKTIFFFFKCSLSNAKVFFSVENVALFKAYERHNKKKGLAGPGSLTMTIFCPLLFSSPSISINQGDCSQQEADLGG